MNAAVVALTAQHPLCVLDVLFPFDFGAERDLVAFDGDLNVLLVDAWNFRVDDVRLVVFAHVHLDADGGVTSFHPNGLEKTAEQLIDSGVCKWVIRN